MHLLVNHLKTNSSNYYTLPSERHSAQISEIKNGRLCLYGAEYLKCNHVMTLGFKRLKWKLSLLGTTRRWDGYLTHHPCQANRQTMVSLSISILLEKSAPVYSHCGLWVLASVKFLLQLRQQAHTHLSISVREFSQLSHHLLCMLLLDTGRCPGTCSIQQLLS